MGVTLASQVGEVQKAEDIEAMVDADHDDIPPGEKTDPHAPVQFKKIDNWSKYLPPLLLYTSSAKQGYFEALFAFSMTMVACFVVFGLFPVEGPRYAWADPAAIPLGLSWSFKDIGLKVTPEMTYPFDPTRAKKLLADAGQGGGFPLEVYAYQLPGLPEGKAFAEAVAGYWEKIGIKTKVVPVDYPAFRKNWFDRKTPGSVGYFNIANRDWIGTFALLEKQAYTPSKPSDTVNDPEVDAMMAQVMRQTDKDKAGALMRNIYLRIRSEHLGVPVVYLHSAYATSKTLPKWTVGTVMYDLFIDQLAASK